ncbi:MAG: peptidase [Acidobacteria bacterium]|nr:peptidase [Acidobacteriota bacterium]
MSRTVKILLLACCALSMAVLGDTQAQVQSAQEDQAKYWVVPGVRHGPSYFKRNFLVETTPLQEGVMDFKHYHKYTEMVDFFKKWEKQYPDLVDLYVVAQSFGGIDIYQLTVTNKKTGKDTDKPAMYIEGNRHAGEVTAAESALWMLHYMLTNYGKDKEVTRLLDNFTYYFRPCNNPDGNLLYLETAQSLRSTIRPYDNDADGLLDEDPPTDLDGDGWVRRMRVKVGAGKGNMVIDTRDPKGRLMRSVPQGQGDYIVVSEGIDNDGDGRVGEDGIGGLDLHRNYVENWRPSTEATGRGRTQGGSGEFPLSEIETRAVFLFLMSHPNVSVVNSMDTSMPMHLRGPSTSPSDERMYPEDLALFKTFDQKGKDITGYARAGDTFMDYSGGRGSPIFGHGPDFGYWYYGSIWYGDELWDGGRFIGDYNKDGTTDELDRLQYNDKELKTTRCQPWTKIIHPQYGEAEVGGWDPKFLSQNPPPDILEVWAEKEARFNLMLASNLPHVVIAEPKISSQGDEYTIEVSVQNQGFIPTALRQAQLVKMVQPDTVSLVFPPGMTSMQGRGGRGGFPGMGGGGARGGGRGGRGEAGQPEQPAQASQDKVQIVEPQGRPVVTVDRLDGNEIRPVTFKVRLNGIAGTEATVQYSSTRGGFVEKRIFIGKK